MSCSITKFTRLLLTCIAPFTIATQRLVSCSSQSQPRIAVIGGGVGGASAAHFLADAFGKRAAIDVFDDGANLGGRLALQQFNGRLFESGGAIIHDKNLYMKYFAKSLGLGVQYASEEMRVAVFDGEEAPLDTSDWYVVKMLQLLRRYGISCFVSLKEEVTAMLSDFSKIYSHQNQGVAFTSVEKLIASMSPRFLEMSKQSVEDYLLAEGFPETFVHELVAGAMRNNYGQNLSIHAFVGAVSLAGAEGGLWSVKGGNRQVAEGLLSRLETQLPDLYRRYSERVTKLAAEGPKWRLSTADGGDYMYDYVILATPCHQNFNIDIQGVSVPKLQYQQTVATFVKGRINHEALKLESRAVRYNLLTGTPRSYVPFNSIGYQFDVNGHDTSSVYKVFSPEVLTTAQLNSLFSRITSSSHVSWLAYPKYDVGPLQGDFILAPGLFYTSPIELAASAMEMSALSGRNAALLVYNTWANRTQLTDPSKMPSQTAERVQLRKGEL